MADRIAYWYSRLWCLLDGHQAMPHAGGYVCIRSACRDRVMGHG